MFKHSHFEKEILLACVFVMGLSVGSLATAQVVTVPTGLNPGDDYRLVYVTTSNIAASSTNINDYNNLVQGSLSAELLALTSGDASGWRAIVSTASDNALLNTLTTPGTDGAGIPIYNLADNILATSYADLWDGSLANSVSYEMDGLLTTDFYVWSGTANNGATAGGLGSGTSPSFFSIAGRPNQSSGSWIYNANDTQTNSWPVYAISPVLTVSAVPEPSTYAFLSMGVMVAFLMLKRRIAKKA